MLNSPIPNLSLVFQRIAICLIAVVFVGCDLQEESEVTFDADKAMKQIESVELSASERDSQKAERLKNLEKIGNEVADSLFRQGRFEWLDLIKKFGMAMYGIEGSIEGVESKYLEDLAEWKPEGKLVGEAKKLSGPGWIMTVTLQVKSTSDMNPEASDVTRLLREYPNLLAVRLKEQKKNEHGLAVVVECALAKEK